MKKMYSILRLKMTSIYLFMPVVCVHSTIEINVRLEIRKNTSTKSNGQKMTSTTPDNGNRMRTKHSKHEKVA